MVVRGVARVAPNLALSGLQVLDTDALAALEPVPCLYQDRVRLNWWEDATAGILRGNYPYRKYFLADELAPAAPFRRLMGALTR